MGLSIVQRNRLPLCSELMPLLVPKDELPRIRNRDLGILCAQMDWSDSAQGFVTPHASFETVLQSLLNHDLWFDAATLLAHALAPREAIWWAAQVCGGRLAGEETSGTEADDAGSSDDAVPAKLVEAARAWVLQPEEQQRQLVHDLALSVPNNVPAHWVGMSVFWATGNITPDAGVVTPPPPFLYARGVSAAIDLAASLAAMDRPVVYELAFQAGIDIAQGGTGEAAA